MDCEYGCIDNWLPVDGELDEADGVLLIYPTEFTRCFCSDTDNLPEGVIV